MDSHVLVLSLLVQMVAALPLSPLPPLPALSPSVGRVANVQQEILVVGTVHTPSRRQQLELTSLITASRPDVVLLELDQERLDQLQVQGAASFYGAEFATAAAEAERCGAIIVLGDVRERDSLAAAVRLRAPLIDLQRLSRAARIALSGPSTAAGTIVHRVNVGAALLADPNKLLPIAVSAVSVRVDSNTHGFSTHTHTKHYPLSRPRACCMPGPHRARARRRCGEWRQWAGPSRQR